MSRKITNPANRMLNRKAYKIFIILIFVFNGMLSSRTIPELVLCIGTDGHLALEPSNRELHHAQMTNSSLSDSFRSLDAENRISENDCRDVKLTSADFTAITSEKLGNFISLNHNLVADPQPFMPLIPKFKQNFQDSILFQASILNSIRTTVLLI